jgi:hypothetical protein
MTTMTSAEQLILEMINRARMDPDGEAARLAQTHPGFTLNEGLAAGTISSTPKQVLAGNNTLAGVADNHNAAMLSSHVLDNNSLNPHTQAGDGSEVTRIANAGYQETYPAFQTYHDENIAWQGTSGAIDLASMTQQVEDGLFVDSYDSTRLHRVAIMDGTMREVGVGETTGVVQGYNSVVVTEDFGISGTNSFLTGAVYNDVNGNNFYDLNEGVQGVTATVTTTAGALVGSDTTGSGGGWSVSEPGGTYNVTFTGAGIVAGGVMATVAGGNLNAKVDLVNGNAIFSNVNTTLGAGATDLHLLGIGNINGTGNAANNVFYGTKGNNVFDGGLGSDTVVYSGTMASYGIAQNADGSITVTGPDGTDTLISIEKIQFKDQAYTPPNTNPGSVSINDAQIVEGNNGTQLLNFTVTRSGGTAAFDVNYATSDGTATVADNDYVGVPTTALHFNAGDTTKTVSVTINGDTKVEGNESFNVNLTGATNGATISKGVGVGTITNDDVAPVAGSVSINDAQIVEGNSGTQLLNFTVTRSGGTAAFDVNYATQDGTATVADNDYVNVPTTALHFNAGDTTKTVSVTINGDTKVEGNESFNVNLTGATNGATISKGVGIGIITNDDVAPVAGSVSINDAQIVEGNSGTQLLNFTVTRSGGTAAFDVNYATQDGTATVADNDYVNVPTTALHFNAGDATKTVSVTINGDTKVEANESFNVNLSGATNGATISKGVGVGIITNDDAAPVAGSVSIGDAQIVEGNSGTQLLNFTVTRSGGTAAFDVNYATSDGTATVADNDYVNVPTTALHFNAGDTTKTVSVTINGDTKVEGNESFNVNLTGATNGATISKGVGVGIITNDDVAIVDTPPTVTASNITASRGQSFAASSLFTAKDADGDTISKYAFWDTGTNGGHFVLNGVAQGVSQEIDVTAAQLSQLSYQSGSGADTLWVAAYDGKQWGNWSNSFTVTGQADTAPTVTASNVTASRGQSFAASSLFMARDADGDAITKYAFWDTGAGGGHFVLNGVAQGVSQEIDVTAAQLSQLSYQSGTAADTLWVAAYDGTMWGNWSNSFTVTGQPDTAPTVTASNVTAAHGQSFAAFSLFTARDADGDAITKYAFWDTGTGGGHFVLNGVAQGVGQEIDVTAAQLSQLSYQSGSGADTLWVAAYDGTMWGNWSNSFSVTAPIDTAPTVTTSNVTAAHGQSFAASSLFTARDADGDAITKYAFWDAGSGGGHLVLNGVAQGVNQEIDVTAAQLSQLSYQSGSGADTLWVAAYDGTTWGNSSSSFSVTAPIDSGPTVTPTNSEIKSFANQNFAASSLFSYSDPFGSPATQYDFWNTGGGGGHFVLNGTALGANQHNIISATQLGQLSYQVGTGSDTIWVGANDGTVWGGWSKGFTISDPPAVAAGETITLGSGFAGQVDFLSDTGTLKLENSSSFAGTVAGLCGQDAIDFADIGFGANSTLGYAANSDHSGGTLSVGDGTHMANIALLGSYMASTFVAASDGHGGTLISEAAHASTQMPVVTQPHA